MEGSITLPETETPAADQLLAARACLGRMKSVRMRSRRNRSQKRDPPFGATPAPAQRLSIVHGDYRTGNYLQDGEDIYHSGLNGAIGDPGRSRMGDGSPLVRQ